MLLDFYLWLKALHIISVIAWMAGLLYLPRLYVYHSQAAAGGELSEKFKIMEARLLRAIMNPAMIATYLFAILMLVAQPSLLSEPWMHAKLVLVLVLTAMHHYFARARKAFLADANTKNHRHYRIMNEVPTLAMIGIVILVAVQPF